MTPKTGPTVRLISLFILIALLLAACTPAATPAPVQQPAETTKSEQKPAEEAKPSDPTKAPEATAVLEPAKPDPVEISYIYPNGIPQDKASVEEAMNKILLEKANATITLNPVDWGAYTDKVNLMVSAGESCDLLFVAPWMNPSFAQLYANGALAPLNDMLDANAPALKESIPTMAWNATSIDGKIYGVPNQQIWVKPFGTSVRKDLAEKYQFDFATVQKLEDLEPLLKAIKEGEDDVYPTSGGVFVAEHFGWDPIGVVAVRYDDASMEVFNGYDTPEFKASVELMARWYNAGYTPSEFIPGEEFNNVWKAGRIGVDLMGVIKPGVELEFKNNRGYDVISKNLSPIFMTTGSVTATMNAVCNTSKNPEVAVKVLELLNTDKELYNILAKGVEGKHWEWVDQANNIIGPGPEQDNYNPGTDWMFGSVFNAYYGDKAYADVQFNEATAKLNEDAAASVALGFTFNPDPVKNELAQVGAVIKEYGEPLIFGMVDPATAYPEFLEKLNEAGIDRIVQEAQTQLNEWAKNK
jgi:putative aldouronate transport system substrate-binding protein